MDNRSNDKPLFSGFPEISTAEWEERIIKDLKGADYERKLIWNTPEGFQVKPYYRAEDLEQLGYLQTLPGEFPYLRGFTKGKNDWIIRQEIPLQEPHIANQLAREAISRGAQAVGFDVSHISSHHQLHLLLKEIDLTKTGVHFRQALSWPQFISFFLHVIKDRKCDASRVSGSLQIDPIASLLANGSLKPSWDEAIKEIAEILNRVHPVLPSVKVCHISGDQFQNSGSTLVQELAFSLASGNEYLSALTTAGCEAGVAASHITFSFALGNAFFLEIAKLRAARLLWSTIVNAYHPADIHSCRMDLHGISAQWNMSVFDPYVNLLRSTTEGMAGALGNADSITILPFDLSYEKPSPFAERIARNQQLIFKEEAHLDKVADTGAGSYLIETLTDAMVTNAWDLFRSIEEAGGILTLIRQNKIQEQVEASRMKKEKAIAQRSQVIIGTNQYPNLSERMHETVQCKEESSENKPDSVNRLMPFRASGSFDRIRLATEAFVAAGNKQPSVFLFTAGNLAMLRARAGFATNFYGCAGFDIIDNPGFKELDQGVEAALASGAEMVVLCSSDEEYPSIVPPVVTKLKSRNPGIIVIVAGYPKEAVDGLKSAGIDGFIHLKSNLLEELQAIQYKLGIIDTPETTP